MVISFIKTYMPPGPFEISDLNPTSSAGDLEVTIKESDNSETVYTVPYAAVPILQREKVIQNILLRLANIEAIAITRKVLIYFRGGEFWGLPWDITAYGGAQFSEWITGVGARPWPESGSIWCNIV